MLLPHTKFFFFKKRGLKLVSLPHFLHDVWSKMFLLLYSINWPNLLFWMPLLYEIIGNMCIVIVCWPGSDVINFEINLIFLFKPFFLHGLKVRRELSRWNKKHFKGLSLMQINIFFAGESPTLMHNVPKWLDILQKSCSKCCICFWSVSDHFGTLCIKCLNHLRFKSVTEATVRKCFSKKVFLKILHQFTKKHLSWNLFH